MTGNDFDRAYQAVGRFRSYSPQPQILATFPVGGSASTKQSVFRIPLVNVRTRLNVRVFSEYETEAMAGTGGPGGSLFCSAEVLWAAIRTKTPRRGAMVPLRNIVGTWAAALSIPTDPALYGHEFTVEEVGGDADGQVAKDVFGTWAGVGAGGSKPYAGRVWVSATYESVYPVTDEEWSRVVQRASIVVPEVAAF